MNWRDVVGEVGVREPVVCALSGKPVAGKHAAHIYLRAPYYVMVLANRYELWTEERRLEVEAMIIEDDKKRVTRKGGE